MYHRALGGVLMTVVLVSASCGAATDEDELLVFAAASLTDAFAAVAEAYEAAHPETDVVLSFASSSSLRDQILEGAPADVFAAANTATMDQVVGAGAAAGEPAAFTANELQIAVPPGNPAGVTGLDDFAADDLLIGLCAATAPCGNFALQSLEKAGVVPTIDTNEPDVRALLTKIEAGELDAGIVYRTDVIAAAGKVDGIGIPAGFNVRADYPIAALAEAPHPAAAASFVAFVLSDEGQEIMDGFGFVSP
jgi:molybdate transport system substrate-binding protein